MRLLPDKSSKSSRHGDYANPSGGKGILAREGRLHWQNASGAFWSPPYGCLGSCQSVSLDSSLTSTPPETIRGWAQVAVSATL